CRIALDAARRCRALLGANGVAGEFHGMRHAANLEPTFTYEATDQIPTLAIRRALTGLSAHRQNSARWPAPCAAAWSPRRAPAGRPSASIAAMRADVVIAGAGVVGASVAWHLRRLGVHDVVLLEREKAAGMGSTGRATGGFRAQFGTEINVRLSLLAREKLL